MRENLFEGINYTDDYLWVVKEFLNTLDNAFFTQSVNIYLVNGNGVATECASCEFPGDLDEYEERFEGVRCRFMDDTVVVTKDEFMSCLKEACKRYAELHPTEGQEIHKILDSL